MKGIGQVFGVCAVLFFGYVLVISGMDHGKQNAVATTAPAPVVQSVGGSGGTTRQITGNQSSGIIASGITQPDVQQPQPQAKASATCTSGATVQIADDGSIWMPNGNPVDEYDCSFTPSQTKQLYWKGVNAELSISGKGELIPMQSANQWIQINAGTRYHVHGLGGNGGFALQTNRT